MRISGRLLQVARSCGRRPMGPPRMLGSRHMVGSRDEWRVLTVAAVIFGLDGAVVDTGIRPHHKRAARTARRVTQPGFARQTAR